MILANIAGALARLRASGIARRRGEEEGAEALFFASDDELGGFKSAMREQPPKKSVCINLRYSPRVNEDLLTRAEQKAAHRQHEREEGGV